MPARRGRWPIATSSSTPPPSRGRQPRSGTTGSLDIRGGDNLVREQSDLWQYGGRHGADRSGPRLKRSRSKVNWSREESLGGGSTANARQLQPERPELLRMM